MIGFGNKIRKLRKELNITQKELAEKMHVTQASIANYENEIKCPDIDKILWLCNFFNVSVDYMLGVTEIELPYQYTHQDVLRFSSFILDDNNDKFYEYYNRLTKENKDYICGMMIKLFREQDSSSSNSAAE